MAQGAHQRDVVEDELGCGELGEVHVCVGAGVPACGAAVAAGVGGHDVVAEGGEGEEEVAPGVGEFWEAVEEEDEWGGGVPGGEDEGVEAAGGVGCEVDVALADGGVEGERGEVGHGWGWVGCHFLWRLEVLV